MRRSLPPRPIEAAVRAYSRFRWTSLGLLILGCHGCPPPGPAWVVQRVPHDPAVFPQGAVRAARKGIAVGWRYEPDPTYPTATPLVWHYQDRGRTWTLVWTGPLKSGAFKAVADLAGGWVAAGDDDPWLSSDGTTWTRKPLPESPRLLYGMLNMVGAAKLLLFGSVGDGAEFWTSTDRVNWVKVPEQASLGDHTTGHPSSRYVWDATWDGTTIVAIGKQTDPTPAGALENREPLVWLSADLGTTWQTVTPPAASGYEAILLSRIFHWGGLWTITGNGRIPATGVVDPLAWTSPDGRTWTLQGSGESINTSGAGDKFSGVQALAGCNGGFSTGAGSTSNRARLWSYSTLGTWSAITTSAFDADPTSGLLGIDNPCSDYDVLVGWAENGGVRVAAAWTYGPP